MDETLTIENLGPIKKLEIKPRPLTIIIGEQASGKSLVAQLLYFFRGLEHHLARIYNAELISQPKWHSVAIEKILDSLRGTPFVNFANAIVKLNYANLMIGADWTVKIESEKSLFRASKKLNRKLDEWIKVWQNDPQALGGVRLGDNFFIPAERDLITRLLDAQPGVLFASSQPKPLREFAELLNNLIKILQSPRTTAGMKSEMANFIKTERSRSYALECQRKALGGEAIAPQNPRERWTWRTDSKVLPILATSSGQMGSWPFFEVAAFLESAIAPINVYFEEPETHLHPRAQVGIMKVVAYLVNRGHNFVITTHSPFLLQVVDNMLQRFQSLKGEIPEGEERWLDPEKVAAYCLRRDSDESPEDIMDRKETGLLDATELEKVSNELGTEFDELLYGAE